MSSVHMPPSQLPAATLEGLQRVGRRRMILLVVRGLAGVLAATAVACLAAAMADRLLLLDDAARWAVSAGFFSVLLLAVLLAALPCLRRWEVTASARLVETAMPQLKDRLLAAVELARDEKKTARGSPAFRNALQQAVSTEMDGLKVKTVLPWQRIRGVLLVACGAVVVCGGLFALPTLSLPQHLMRVLFPSANIARPSAATVRFLAPASPEQIVPLGERLAVLVEVTLPPTAAVRSPETLQLEVETLAEPPSRRVVELMRQPADASPAVGRPLVSTYQGQWLVEAARQRVRAVSPIGETPWFLLEAAPRPEVQHVAITVTPPAYAGVQPVTTTADRADVTAVIGSQVHWAIRPSGPLQSAELIWLDPASDSTEPMRHGLSEGPDGSWSLDVSVATTRRLQFDLISRVGMRSEFPDTARLTAVEDMPPRLAWQQPETHEATVGATSSHALEVGLLDEFPLTSLEQWVRINRGVWVTSPQPFDPAASEQTVAWQWELAPLILVPGDLVETKLVAVDRRGLQGESPMLEWVISDSLLELAAVPRQPARREITRQLASLADQAAEALADSRFEPLVGRDGQRPDDEQIAAAAADLRAAADRLGPQLATIREAIHTALRETDDRLTADELKLTAAAASRIEVEDADTLRQAAARLEQAAKLPDADARKAQEAAVQQAQRVRRDLEQLDRRFRSLAGQDVLDEAAVRLDAAAQFQAELLRRPERIGSEAYAREQQLLAVHMRALALTLERDAPLLPGGAARQAISRSDWAEEMADRLERSGRSPVPADDATAVARATTEARELLKELESNRSVHGIFPGLSGEARQARQALRQLAGTSAAIVERVGERLKESADFSPGGLQALAEPLEQLNHRRAAVLAEVGSQQTETAADLGAASRGLDASLEDMTIRSGEVGQSFAETSTALQTLEAAGRLASVLEWVDQMLASERDAADRVTAHTATPRLWEATSQELEDTSTAIRQAGLPTEVAERVRAARWSPAAEEIGRKVSPRQWDLKPTISAVANLETLRGDLQQQFDALAEPIAKARAALRALAPSIPDLARAAAEQAARQREATEQLVAEEAAGETTDLQAVLSEDAPGDAEMIERLESALVDAAASQDLLNAAERERARDADLARELVSSSQQRVERATTEARQQQGADRAESLDRLADALAEAEDTFSMIADHFDRDPRSAPAVSPDATAESLRAMAAQQTPAAAAKLDEAYEDAERLADVADAPAEDLLRRLEEELRTNLPMREALSEIAAGLAEQSQQALAFAAERERSLRHDVESSDPMLREKKRQFAAELRWAGEQTARVAQRLGQEAQRQAEAAGFPQRQEQLSTLATDLEQASEAVRAVADTASVPELVAVASRLDQAIDTATPGLAEASQALAAAASEPLEQTDDQERRALSEATVASGRWHQQDVRWADQELRMRERRVQEADRLVQEAGRQLEQAQAREEKAREQLSREPESAARQEQVLRAEVQRREAEAVTGLASEIRQREQRRLDDAGAVRELAGRQPAILDAANPRAQLAERLTNQAADQADRLSRQLGRMLSDSGWQEQLNGSQGQLDVSARQQDTVTASVAEAARSLERAAAHEMRLGGFATAGQLADAAQRVDATARQEPVAAGEALRQAAESDAARSPQGRASPDESQAAVDAVSRAGEAIAQRADELARLLSPAADSEDGSNSREAGSQGGANEGSSSSGPQNQPLNPAEMAKMLDQLDRELRQSQPGSPTRQGQSGEPSAARRSLARAQNQLARGLQEQRGTPGTPASQQQSPSMTDAEATPSMATQSGSGLLQEASVGDATGEVRLLDADGREVFIGGWNRLRQQQAGEVVESLRDTISPRYRRQVEQYFRVLSERGQAEEERR
jgi:hypothetical protein